MFRWKIRNPGSCEQLVGNKMKSLLLLLGLSTISYSSLTSSPPHIIFIIADDLGVNDVGWNNPLIHTPNIGIK